MKASGALPPGHAVLDRLYGFRDTRKGAIWSPFISLPWQTDRVIDFHKEIRKKEEKLIFENERKADRAPGAV
jgi:hypothetical protein